MSIRFWILESHFILKSAIYKASYSACWGGGGEEAFIIECIWDVLLERESFCDY